MASRKSWRKNMIETESWSCSKAIPRCTWHLLLTNVGLIPDWWEHQALPLDQAVPRSMVWKAGRHSQARCCQLSNWRSPDRESPSPDPEIRQMFREGANRGQKSPAPCNHLNTYVCCNKTFSIWQDAKNKMLCSFEADIVFECNL